MTKMTPSVVLRGDRRMPETKPLLPVAQIFPREQSLFVLVVCLSRCCVFFDNETDRAGWYNGRRWFRIFVRAERFCCVNLPCERVNKWSSNSSLNNSRVIQGRTVGNFVLLHPWDCTISKLYWTRSSQLSFFFFLIITGKFFQTFLVYVNSFFIALH